MRHVLLICMLLLSGAPAARGDMDRAIWIWGEATELLNDAQVRGNTLDFLERQGIGTLYLWSPGNSIVSAPGAYRTLISEVHARGGQVYSLQGDPAFVLPKNQAKAVAQFQAVLDYNVASRPEERFDGVNLDVEPHGLADWSTNSEQRVKQYLDLSKAYMQAKAAAGADLAVGPAIPFWYDTFATVDWNGSIKPVSEHVQDLYDYVTLMDYRDYALGSGGIVALAASEIDYARSLNKRVVIGVETGAVSPEKVTFYEEGAGVLEEQLALVADAYADHVGFGGFAIHSLTSYREMVVPEPASLSLFLGGLVLVGRRKS